MTTASAAVSASSLASVNDPAAAVTYHRLCLAYRGRTVLRDIQGELAKGSLTAVIGPNGAGKSSLLKATLGLMPASAGRVECHVPRVRVAYLAQQSQIDRQFPLSVFDCVTLGFWPAARLWRRVGAEQRAQALEALEAAGLLACAARPIATLSSGQFQRMLFVRVQLQNADFIVLDEPFNAVDEATTEALLQVVARWHGEGRTVLAVLHDFRQVQRWFPQSLLLADGRVQAWGPTDSVLQAMPGKGMPAAAGGLAYSL